MACDYRFEVTVVPSEWEPHLVEMTLHITHRGTADDVESMFSSQVWPHNLKKQ
jgi:hypothetical protein